MKSHIQIEGDQQVLERVAALIDQQFSQAGATGPAQTEPVGLRGFKEILEGKHDDVPEGNFYMRAPSRRSKAEVMAGTMKLEVATPGEVVYSGDVDMVTLPASEGQIGIRRITLG